MKCTHCIEGKLLPAIPIPGKQPEEFPDCDYCNGTGEHEPNAKWYYEGLRLQDIRIASGTNMRKFCMDNRFDAVQISKIERGLRSAPKHIVKAYEAL